jgi:hypothetical protein
VATRSKCVESKNIASFVNEYIRCDISPIAQLICVVRVRL